MKECSKDMTKRPSNNRKFDSLTGSGCRVCGRGSLSHWFSKVIKEKRSGYSHSHTVITFIKPCKPLTSVSTVALSYLQVKAIILWEVSARFIQFTANRS